MERVEAFLPRSLTEKLNPSDPGMIEVVHEKDDK